MKANAVVIEQPRTNSRLFAHTRWDAIPVLAAIFHCLYFFGMFYLFPRVPLWIMLVLGFVYSVSVTTREPRAEEIDGTHYRFVADEDFDRLIREGELLEWAEIVGHRSGTARRLDR